MSVNLFAVTFDCADAAGLATFWSGVLERPVEDGATAGMASIAPASPPDRGPHWYFVQVPEGKTAKNRLHQDLTTPDLAAEVQHRALVADLNGQLKRWLADKPAPAKIAGMETPAYAFISDKERKELVGAAPRDDQ